MINDKQMKFINEYLKDFNKIRAYKEAYGDVKYNTAKCNSSKLLKKKEVAEVIKERQMEMNEKYSLTRDKIIKELSYIAFSRPVAKKTQKMVERERFDTTINDIVIESKLEDVVEVKDYDELDYAERATVKSYEKTKYGIKIEQYDKQRALELLCKILGMTDVEQSSSNNDIYATERLKELSDEELMKLAGMDEEEVE